MSNPTEQHLEHAEHAEHAGHNPFDRRVAISIAVTAALLSCATLLSHRAHTLTLSLQQEATDEFTKASNQWNYFQSKKNRQYLFEGLERISRRELKRPESEQDTKAYRSEVQTDIDFWNTEVTRYKTETKDIEKEARGLGEEADKLRKESKHVHHLGDNYDLAELGIELGLVLCSIALMTKKKEFWYSSMALTALGSVLMVFGIYQQYFAHGGH